VTLRQRTDALIARAASLVRAIQNNDSSAIEQAVLRLSRSRRIFAPLAFAVGAFVLLFDGLRLMLSNWRLALVQILPAMWIWLAMFDLKLHVLHGHQFDPIRGPVLIPLFLLVVALTIASFYLNAVFAFAIAQQRRPPEVEPALREARRYMRPIAISGGVVGLLLAFSTLIVTRSGRPWFAICLGIVVGLMMISYIAVPARLIGGKRVFKSRRDKLTTSAVGGAIGATVSAPPYLMGRIGLLLLGTKILWPLGVVLIAVGATLQAGATGAVRAIKMSVKLGVAGPEAPAPQPSAPERPA